MAEVSTLFKPIPTDPSQSVIENHLELTDLSVIGPNLFTNARPSWRPPGAKGIYGGALVAQCLAAAYKTVPESFDIHSLHCYFMLPGNARCPIIFHVEQDRNGRSFMIRSVKATQYGNCVFKATMSFVLGSDDNKAKFQHAQPMPENIKIPTDENLLSGAKESKGPLIFFREKGSREHSQRVHENRVRVWTKIRGKISEVGGRRAHLMALAYLSDHLFLGTVRDIHNPNYNQYEDKNSHKMKNESVKSQSTQDEGDPLTTYLKNDVQEIKSEEELGMVVSLDHTIYFHAPGSFRADEWMLSDMSSPWSGQERGLVKQYIFSVDGTLIATCHQEGLLRFNKPKPSKNSKL